MSPGHNSSQQVRASSSFCSTTTRTSPSLLPRCDRSPALQQYDEAKRHSAAGPSAINNSHNSKAMSRSAAAVVLTPSTTAAATAKASLDADWLLCGWGQDEPSVVSLGLMLMLLCSWSSPHVTDVFVWSHVCLSLLLLLLLRLSCSPPQHEQRPPSWPSTSLPPRQQPAPSTHHQAAGMAAVTAAASVRLQEAAAPAPTAPAGSQQHRCVCLRVLVVYLFAANKP